ncbi:MAG TPA: glycosyltransferase family 2 protein [Bacteroidales bacterium]|nr:glycosyltransferase family 2 protein [Bacteroidales bacterium]
MVSVIMAAYNTRGFVSAALDSVFSQTYPDFQIIVVDDASSDGTADILRSYNDSRLVVLHNETRRGAAYSRNRALKEATGELLAVLDADDFWAPDKLEEQVGFMNEHPTAAGVGSYVYETDQTGRRIRALRFPVYPGQIRCSTFFRCAIVHSSVMLRRSFMTENNLRYDETFPGSHDFELWSRAVFAGDFHHIPRYLTYYRRNPGQISEDITGTQKEHAIKVYRNLLQKMGYEPTQNELDCHLRLSGIIAEPKNESKGYQSVLIWCEKIYRKNLEKQVFREYLFANEILLRFLKYCYDNSLGSFRTLRLMICLHWRMRWCFFPYFQLFQRLSINFKDV